MFSFTRTKLQEVNTTGDYVDLNGFRGINFAIIIIPEDASNLEMRGSSDGEWIGVDNLPTNYQFLRFDVRLPEQPRQSLYRSYLPSFRAKSGTTNIKVIIESQGSITMADREYWLAYLNDNGEIAYILTSDSEYIGFSA